MEIKKISKCLFAMRVKTGSILISFALNTNKIDQFLNMKYDKLNIRRLYKKYYYDILIE